MSRLTYNKPNGEWGIEGVDLSALPPKVYGAVAKLKDIESGRYPDVASTELALRTLADDVAGGPPRARGGREDSCNMLGCAVLLKAARVLKLYIAGGRTDGSTD